MKDPESKTIFASVDGRTDTELPEWYRQRHGGDDLVSFAEAIHELPQAVESTVAYKNPYTDEGVETERFNALVKPSRAQEQGREGDIETDPLFHIPTDSYAIINPIDVYGPLEEVLREETIDGTPLGEALFDELGDELYAVGWYDSSEEPRTGAVYLNDAFREAVSADGDEHTILNDALLSRIGRSSHEMLDEQLVASTNIFESLVDIHVHVGEERRIVVAIDRANESQILEFLSVI
jgi:hypothetical protein